MSETPAAPETPAPAPVAKVERNYKPLSKSQCARALKQVFGPTVRFMKIDGDGLAVMERVGPTEKAIVEVRPKAPGSAAQVHFAAMVAAFRTLGYKVERAPHGLDLIPIFKTKEQRDETVAAVKAAIGNVDKIDGEQLEQAIQKAVSEGQDPAAEGKTIADPPAAKPAEPAKP